MAYDFPADRVLSQVAHRPWPRPARPWALKQSWHHLLFAHWPVDAQHLRTLLPAGLELDVRGGAAWLGVVAFGLTNVAPRWVPPLPGLSAFAELNVRTYVTYRGKPGLYFLSLDASSRLAVLLGRGLFRLPYDRATIEVQEDAGWVRCRSHREDDGSPRADFQARYRAMGEPTEARRGSIEAFLVERYCLYNLGYRRFLYRLQIHHPPWQLQAVEARLGVNTVAQAAGVTLPGTPPLLHYVRRQDMVAYLPERA